MTNVATNELWQNENGYVRFFSDMASENRFVVLVWKVFDEKAEMASQNTRISINLQN